MNVPVAILIVPTVAIGGALMFGGENSPWARFFAPQFARSARRSRVRHRRYPRA